MDILIILISISVSFDALSLGIVNSMRNIRLPLKSNIVILISSILYTEIALFFGKGISMILPPTFGKVLGFLMLFLLGVYFSVKGIRTSAKGNSTISEVFSPNLTSTSNPLRKIIEISKEPSKADLDRSSLIDVSESLFVGFALSIDAITTGIGCSVTGYTPITLPFLVGFFQFCGLIIGNKLGKEAQKTPLSNSRFFVVLPGLFMIILSFTRLL